MWGKDKRVLVRFYSGVHSDYYLFTWRDWCEMSIDVIQLLSIYREKNYRVEVVESFKDMT